MSVLASDTFVRANGALGANWASINGAALFKAMTIVSNQASSFDDPHGNRYTAATWPADQYSQATLTGLALSGSDDGPGVAIRIASAADTLYFMQIDTGNKRLWKVITGGFTTIKSDALASVNNCVAYLEGQGTTLLAKKDGANLFGGAFTDSGIASGQAGIAGSADPQTVTLNTWSGGDFAAGGADNIYNLRQGVIIQAVQRGAFF